MIPLMKNTFMHEIETRKALSDFILQTDRLSMDEQCFRFEKEFAIYQGSREAVLFNSGSSANLAMFQTLKNISYLKDGDGVGFSSLTWATNVMPLIQLGLRPIPLDCNSTTINVMSSNLLERLEQEPEMKALSITNALGLSGDLGKIRDICKERGIIFVEDNCESLGSELSDGKTGTFGAMSSFSFFVAHHLSTIEGGMVCTDDEELAKMLRIVRANGWDRNLTAAQGHQLRKHNNVSSELDGKYTFYDLGFNLRPTEITGFLGNLQLGFLSENISLRKRKYDILTAQVRENSDLIEPDSSHMTKLSPFAFPVLCRTPEIREHYISRFSGAGVEIRPLIAGNIQRQPFYKKYVSRDFDLPGTDQLNDCGFYCGIFPELTTANLETLCSCLTQ
jgi:CDP-4-dehydro-6-deoxyglucose reductase, E1